MLFMTAPLVVVALPGAGGSQGRWGRVKQPKVIRGTTRLSALSGPQRRRPEAGLMTGETAQPATARFEGIDGLRALAAGSVLAYHE